MQGLTAGFQAPVAKIDGKPFKADKAYKDSKLCNMLVSRALYRRYPVDTGVDFSSLYPGCVADTALSHQTEAAFRRIFPWFQKNITKGYVIQALAGKRVAEGVADGAFAQPGEHWVCGNRQQAACQAFSQPLSVKAHGLAHASRLWDLSEQLVGLH